MQACGVALALMLFVRRRFAAQNTRERLLAEAANLPPIVHLPCGRARTVSTASIGAVPVRADVRCYSAAPLLNLKQLPDGVQRKPVGTIALRRLPVCQGTHPRGARLRCADDGIAPRLSSDCTATGTRCRRLVSPGAHSSTRTGLRTPLPPTSKPCGRRGAKPRVRRLSAFAQDGFGQSNAAEKSFHRAVEFAGGSWRPHVAYGAFLFRQSPLLKASALQKQAFALAPDVVDVRFELARAVSRESFGGGRPGAGGARASNECRVHNLLARIFSAQGESGAAERRGQGGRELQTGSREPLNPTSSACALLRESACPARD